MEETLQQTPLDQPEPLPFPYSQRTFCPYEPVEQSIEAVRVLVVNCLLQDERDLSDYAREDWGAASESRLGRERAISCLAVDNIVNNVTRLVREPETRVVHLSEVADAAREFRPQAIVLSGTLTDFDYYDPQMLARFARFVRRTRTPVLGICGGHQLVGVCFGAHCVTLDNAEPREQQQGRFFEYQYRYVNVTEPDDPIFRGIDDCNSGGEQDSAAGKLHLRVWQNHGLMLDRVPEGFKLLAVSNRCRNQMMVRREGGQLIYAVQFHLEKSFQDLTSNLSRIDPNLPPEERKRLLRQEASTRTNWAHPVESRHGRILFQNFLRLALEHDPGEEADAEPGADLSIADFGLRIAESAQAESQSRNASGSQHETGM